jgi:nucleoside-diphosphate-sugar epimerase
MSDLHVVTGAGPVGWTVAEQLARAGQEVRVLTRSGSGPEHPLIERRAVDVSDAVAFAAAARGARAVFHCVHGTSYSEKTWRRELPGTEQTVLRVAHDNGAVVVFPESLYSYTRPTEPMTEDNPRDWDHGKGAVRRDLLRARADSPTDTVSVVASDFVGPRLLANGYMGERVVSKVLDGGTIRVLGSLDQPHSWTYVPDLAAAMVRASQRPDLWNTVLHAPTNAPLTQRQMIAAFVRAAGTTSPRLGTVPGWLLRAIGLVHPPTRELAVMQYQLEQPFVMESGKSQALLDLAPTPVEEMATQTIAWWRTRVS